MRKFNNVETLQETQEKIDYYGRYGKDAEMYKLDLKDIIDDLMKARISDNKEDVANFASLGEDLSAGLETIKSVSCPHASRGPSFGGCYVARGHTRGYGHATPSVRARDSGCGRGRERSERFPA